MALRATDAAVQCTIFLPQPNNCPSIKVQDAAELTRQRVGLGAACRTTWLALSFKLC